MTLFVTRNRGFPFALDLAADCQFYADLFLLSQSESDLYTCTVNVAAWEWTKFCRFNPAASDCMWTVKICLCDRQLISAGEFLCILRSWVWSGNVLLSEAECGQAMCYFLKLSVVRQCVTFRSWAWSGNVLLSEAEYGQCVTPEAEYGQTMCHSRSCVWSENVTPEAEYGQCVTPESEYGQTMCHSRSWVWSDNVSLQNLSMVRQCVAPEAEYGQTMCHSRSWVWSDNVSLQKLSVVRQCVTFRSWVWSGNVLLSEAECGQAMCYFQKLSVVRQCVTFRSWVWSGNVLLSEAEYGQCVTPEAECGQTMCHSRSCV